MRNFFIKDWAWKLFSLFLAITIWLTVHGILSPEVAAIGGQTSKNTYENLPVSIVSSAADVSAYHIAPAVVKVTVSGPPDEMDKLQSSKIRAAVDLTDIATNDNLQRPVNISTPPNVTLLSVEPQTVTVIAPVKH